MDNGEERLASELSFAGKGLGSFIFGMFVILFAK
jgi:hypothetical protein